MKKLLVSLMLLTTLVAFSGSFTMTVQKALSIAKKCQDSFVFTEELYDLKTGETWGIATYIPLDSDLMNLAPSVNKDSINGMLVIQITDEASHFVIDGSVSITGKSKYDDSIDEKRPYIYLITDDLYVRVDNYGDFQLITDKKVLVFLFTESYLLSNYDYIVSLKTSTAVATWKVRRKGMEYKKFREIIKELGY